MTQPVDPKEYHDAWWEAESQLVVVRRERDDARELLAAITVAAGKYIECDERPRPDHLWNEMCEAQLDAATWFNTGRMPDVVLHQAERDLLNRALDRIEDGL